MNWKPTYKKKYYKKDIEEELYKDYYYYYCFDGLRFKIVVKLFEGWLYSFYKKKSINWSCHCFIRAEITQKFIYRSALEIVCFL